MQNIGILSDINSERKKDHEHDATMATSIFLRAFENVLLYKNVPKRND